MSKAINRWPVGSILNSMRTCKELDDGKGALHQTLGEKAALPPSQNMLSFPDVNTVVASWLRDDLIFPFYPR